jgi:hypothetical protein
VSSSLFSAKSVEQSHVEQSQFEQFTPTPLAYIKLLKLKKKLFEKISLVFAALGQSLLYS